MLLVIFVVQTVKGKGYEDMEPVIEIQLNGDKGGNEEIKRDAIKYVEDNYKQIEKKMETYKKGIKIFMIVRP